MKTTIPATKRLIRFSELIEEKRVSRQTIYNWIKRKNFPQPIKVGGAVFFDTEAIDQWILDQAQGGDI